MGTVLSIEFAQDPPDPSPRYTYPRATQTQVGFHVVVQQDASGHQPVINIQTTLRNRASASSTCFITTSAYTITPWASYSRFDSRKTLNVQI